MNSVASWKFEVNNFTRLDKSSIDARYCDQEYYAYCKNPKCPLNIKKEEEKKRDKKKPKKD